MIVVQPTSSRMIVASSMPVMIRSTAAAVRAETEGSIAICFCSTNATSTKKMTISALTISRRSVISFDSSTWFRRAVASAFTAFSSAR